MKYKFLKAAYPFKEWEVVELDERRAEVNKAIIEPVKQIKKAKNKAILKPKKTK